MVQPTQPAHAEKGLTTGRIAFMITLLAIGFGFLGLVAARHFLPLNPPKPDVAQQAKEYLRSRKIIPLSGPLEKLLADPGKSLVPTEAHPLLSKPAPAFELPDFREQTKRLDQLLAKGPIVLVFYYGYYCNHCVSQLFDVNQDLHYFRELGAEVVAISGDPPQLTRERFQQYGEFSFPVLFDPGNKVAQAYRVFKPAQGKIEMVQLHGTFVIGRDGIIHWGATGEEPFSGNNTLLHQLARLESRLPVKASE